MKLHLPKALLAAVVMACSAVHADTGWDSNTFYIGGDKAGHLNNSINTGYSVTPDVAETPDVDERVTTIEVVDATGKTGTLKLWADDRDSNYAPTNARFGDFKVNAGTILDAGTNSWGENRTFDKLVIDKITVTDRGAATLNITKAEHVVEVASVDGSLGSVSNAGTLVLGTEGGSINLSGTITNTGTASIKGAINVSNLTNFTIAQEGTTTWSDETNAQGFTIINGATLTLATGNVTIEATQVNDNGTMRDLTTTDGVTTFVAGSMTGTVYHLINSDVTAGTASTEGATGYDVASGRTLYIVDSSADNVTLSLQEDSTVSISNASRTFTNSTTAHNVVIEDQGIVTLSGSSGGSSYARGNVDVNAGGKLILDGQDSMGWNANCIKAINITGTEEKVATVQVKGRQTMKTNINLLGNASMTDTGNAALELFGGNITASGSNNTIEGNLMARSAGTITVQENGTLSIEGNLTCDTSNYPSPGTITKDGQGALVFAGSSNTLYGTMDVTAGSVEFTNGLNLEKATTSGTLNMGAGTTLILGTSITNNGEGSVTLGGNLVINNSATGYELYAAAEGGTYSDGENGFFTSTGSKYYLIKGGAVDITNIGTATLDGTSTTTSIELVDDNGGAVFTAGSATTAEYIVNTTVNSSAHDTAKYQFNAEGAKLVVDNNLSNSRIIGTGAVEIASNGTLALDTAGDNLKTLLTTATGTGTIVLGVNTRLTGTETTAAAGKLSISQGVTLTMGTSDTHNVSISSFNTVELDGGKIYFQNKQDTFNNLTVTDKNGTFEMEDMGQVSDNAKLTMAGKTTLNGNLTYINTWNSQIDIEEISGAGQLILNGSKRHSDNTSTISILGADNFTGSVEFTNKASQMKLVVAENLGITTRFHKTIGNADLTGIGAGNSVILQGAAGSLTGGTIAADVTIKNTDDGQLAGVEVSSATEGTTYTYTGTISGSGNYIIQPSHEDAKVSTTTKFTGDTSGWTGKLEVISGEQNVVYSGSTAINNSDIQTRRDADATMNLTIEHASAAVTVNSNIAQRSGSVNLTANATEGVTFKKGVTVSSTTLGAGTTATFEAASDLGNLSLGAGASVTATSDLTLGTLTLDLQSYTTDFTNTHTLVSTTGTLNFTGDLSSYQGVMVGEYTATVERTGSSILLTFASQPSEPDSFIVTGASGCVDGMLTLDVAADLMNYAFTNDGAIVIPGISDSIMKDILGLANLPEDGMVGITLQGTDGVELTATADQQIGFLGKDGVSVYFGENVGSGWQYQVNYIPEPTTATLSLLALAGLAARRRRKA